MEIGWQYRQSYCKNYLAYFFLAHPVDTISAYGMEGLKCFQLRINTIQLMDGLA